MGKERVFQDALVGIPEITYLSWNAGRPHRVLRCNKRMSNNG
jgi:hypothetical protein